MLRASARSGVFFCMLLVAAFCSHAIAAKSASERPIRSVYLAIAEGAQRDFLEQLTRFANANAFAIRIGRTRPEEEKILVQMWREDTKVIVVNPFDPREYRISFYESGREPIAADAVNSLVDDLKAVVSLVHGATFLPRN